MHGSSSANCVVLNVLFSPTSPYRLKPCSKAGSKHFFPRTSVVVTVTFFILAHCVSFLINYNYLIVKNKLNNHN
jgi:preprotein translocase subunit SecG